MVKPSVYNLSIYIGCDFSLAFQLLQEDEVTPINLTGTTIKSQIRLREDVTSTLLASFVVTVPAPTDGTFYLSLTDTITSAITAAFGFYDVLLTGPSSIDEIYIKGKVDFFKKVTSKT